MPNDVEDPMVLRVGSLYRVRLSQLRYFTYSVIGVGLLWPWNCFLSASGFYGDRFMSTPTLVKTYSSTMMSVSTITSTVANLLLAKRQRGANYDGRIKLGFAITAVVFLFMAASCAIPWLTGMNNGVFFALLMIAVFVSAIATALSQNGTMATANVLGPLYANAVMVGQAVAGVLPATALILSIFLTGVDNTPQVGDRDMGVLLYYLTASLIAAASMSLLVYSQNQSSADMYQSLAQTADVFAPEPVWISDENTPEPDCNSSQNPPGLDRIHVDDAAEFGVLSTQTVEIPFKVLWRRLNFIVSAIFLTFCITLAFPVFASAVTSNRSKPRSFFFSKRVFIPFTFLIWNVGDLMGRVLCGYPQTRMLIKRPRVLFFYSLARIAFIPLFFTCNLHDGLNTIITSDAWYLILQLFFGISNGQLATSCFMVIGEYCESEEEKAAAGGFSTVFLSAGLMVGSVLSYILVWLIH
ncbi:nucleoside transporter Fun26p [Diutina catenulata]